MIVAVVAVLAASLGAGLWWHRHETRMRFVRAIPDRPAFNLAQPELFRRVTEAEQRVASEGTPGLVDLSRLYHANGFYAEAGDIYRTLMELESANPRWPHFLASIQAGFGALDEALPLLRRVVTLAPDYLPAQIRLGDALLKANQPSEAEKIYTAVLAHEPANPYAQLGLARLEINAKQTASARERLHRIVSAQPKFTVAWTLLATLDEQAGDQAAAATDRVNARAGGRALEMPDPWLDELIDDCYDVYRLDVVGSAASAAGDNERARRLFERAIALAPNDGSAHRHLGDFHAKLGNQAEARREFEQAVALAPDDSVNWTHLILLLNQAGDQPAVEKVLADGLVRCPQSPALHLERGRRLAAAGKFDEAVAEFEESLRLRPEEARPCVEIAMIRLRQRRLDDARAALGRAQFIEPNYPVTLLMLAQCDILLGHEDDARNWIGRLRSQGLIPPAELAKLVTAYQSRFGRAP